MQTLLYDLAYGLRVLLKTPRFTAAAVLSLAIGIGANTAIFSVTNALLLRPLSYKDADRLVILWNRSPGLNVEQDWFSPGQYLDIKAENRVFEGSPGQLFPGQTGSSRRSDCRLKERIVKKPAFFLP